MPLDRQRIGWNISLTRSISRLTQQQLADAIGAHRTTVVRIENGHLTPSLETLYKMSKVLGCKVSTLLLGV